MRIIVAPMAVPLRAMGPYRQCLSICNEAKSRGHETISFSAKDAVWKNIDGIQNIRAKSPKLLGVIPRIIVRLIIKPLFLSKKNKWSKMNSFEQVQWSLGLSNKKYFFSDYNKSLTVIEKYKPDCIITGRFSVMLAAKKAGVPFVVVKTFNEVSANASNPELTLKTRKKIEKKGLGSFRSILDIALLSDLTFVPELKSMSKLKEEKAIYIGSLRRKKKIRTQKNQLRDTVLVYLGTSFMDKNRLMSLLEKSFKKSGLKVVVVDNSGMESNEFVTVISKFSGHEIFSSLKLMIHHGGFNSCEDSIREGIPSLILPNDHFERQSNATKMELVGTASIWNEDLSDDLFFKKVYDLLNNSDYQLNAKKMQYEYNNSGGLSMMFDHLEKKYGRINEKGDAHRAKKSY